MINYKIKRLYTCYWLNDCECQFCCTFDWYTTKICTKIKVTYWKEGNVFDRAEIKDVQSQLYIVGCNIAFHSQKVLDMHSSHG
jgi:serine kinase of HPr protein (carbohydrate metabolism regulator)